MGVKGLPILLMAGLARGCCPIATIGCVTLRVTAKHGLVIRGPEAMLGLGLTVKLHSWAAACSLHPVKLAFRALKYVLMRLSCPVAQVHYSPSWLAIKTLVSEPWTENMLESPPGSGVTHLLPM